MSNDKRDLSTIPEWVKQGLRASIPGIVAKALDNCAREQAFLEELEARTSVDIAEGRDSSGAQILEAEE